MTSDEEKLILTYFSDRQTQIDAYYDTQNSKIAQIMAINGVLFGIVALAAPSLSGKNIIGIGLLVIGTLSILASTIIAIIGYKSFNYSFGVPKTENEISNLVLGHASTIEERLDGTRALIVKSLSQNIKAVEDKMWYFNIAIYSQYLGIWFLAVGFLQIYL
ncbi:hypothetical protein [Methanoregula boonei]|jgi:uncharacterized membrane protein|uniref:hypothetical protein n=1 Tax=Methanoregula boonei TaxID=358766 RepID=UPI00064F8C4E|nr:hypothetical protein [Methanoregula boonei]